MEQESDKSEVAMHKIIYANFVTAFNRNQIDTEDFIDMESEAMPHYLLV